MDNSPKGEVAIKAVERERKLFREKALRPPLKLTIDTVDPHGNILLFTYLCTFLNAICTDHLLPLSINNRHLF